MFLLTSQLGADKYLLPALEPGHEDRKCVIIDLDETLVHSSFKVIVVETKWMGNCVGVLYSPILALCIHSYNVSITWVQWAAIIPFLGSKEFSQSVFVTMNMRWCAYSGGRHHLVNLINHCVPIFMPLQWCLSIIWLAYST